MDEIFGVVEEISTLGFIIRTFIVGLLVFVVGRFIPKRTINQLTAFDFILAWILGAITVSPLLDGKISFVYIIVPIITLFISHYILNLISLRNRRLSFLIIGRPILLIDNGRIIRSNLKKHFINVDLLLSELRIKNIFDISEVKYTVLEPNGHLSIVKKDMFNTVTPKDLDLTSSPFEIPKVIISDGKVIKYNLKEANVDEDWLIYNLSKHNIDNVCDVFLATVDNKMNLFVSKKE